MKEVAGLVIICMLCLPAFSVFVPAVRALTLDGTITGVSPTSVSVQQAHSQQFAFTVQNTGTVLADYHVYFSASSCFGYASGTTTLNAGQTGTIYVTGTVQSGVSPGTYSADYYFEMAYHGQGWQNNQRWGSVSVTVLVSTFTVTFSAIGFTSGPSWSVTFRGSTQSTTGSSIAFTGVPNGGPYSWTLTPPSGYTASLTSGSITVNGGDVTQGITFTPISNDPVASRGSPSSSSISLISGTFQTFVAHVTDDSGDLNYVEYDLNGVYQGRGSSVSGSSGDSSWSYTFSSTGTYTVQAVVYDSRSDPNHCGKTSWTVAVTAQQGSLRVYVYNIGGQQLISNAKVTLLGVGDQMTGGGGYADFTGLAYGSYNVEVRYQPGVGLNVEEYWGGTTITVNGNVVLAFTRHSQWVYNIQVNGVNPGSWPVTITDGTFVQVKVTIKNEESVSKNVYVRLIIDQDESTPYTSDQNSAIGLIPAGSTGDFTFDFTPGQSGTHYIYVVAYGSYPSGYIPTDQYIWTNAFTVSQTITTVSVQSDVSSVVEDGLHSATITATVLDQFGYPMQYVQVDFSATDGTLSLSLATTNVAGQASTTLTPIACTVSPETVYVYASAGGKQGQTSVIFMPANPKVATPTFSPPSGTYSTSQAVEILCATSFPPVTIRYTTDGSEPTSSSAIYYFPIGIRSGTVTIKAKAFASGITDSDTASATYTIQPQTGSLRVFVHNVGGQLVSGAKVTLLGIGDSMTGDGGYAYFDSLPYGSYNLEVRCQPGTGLSVEEYWGGTPVIIGGNEALVFTRHTQWISNIQVNGANPGSWPVPVSSPTSIPIQIAVKNEESVGKNIYVRLIMDRDEAVSFDFDETSGTSYVGAGATGIFSFSFTPSQSGLYYLYAVVYGQYPSGYVPTDQHMWTSALCGSFVRFKEVTLNRYPAETTAKAAVLAQNPPIEGSAYMPTLGVWAKIVIENPSGQAFDGWLHEFLVDPNGVEHRFTGSGIHVDANGEATYFARIYTPPSCPRTGLMTLRFELDEGATSGIVLDSEWLNLNIQESAISGPSLPAFGNLVKLQEFLSDPSYTSYQWGSKNLEMIIGVAAQLATQIAGTRISLSVSDVLPPPSVSDVGTISRVLSRTCGFGMQVELQSRSQGICVYKATASYSNLPVYSAFTWGRDLYDFFMWYDRVVTILKVPSTLQLTDDGNPVLKFTSGDATYLIFVDNYADKMFSYGSSGKHQIGVTCSEGDSQKIEGSVYFMLGPYYPSPKTSDFPISNFEKWNSNPDIVQWVLCASNHAEAQVSLPWYSVVSDAVGLAVEKTIKYVASPNQAIVQYFLQWPGSQLDLDVYDQSGRHTGFNYTLGEVDLGIPNSEYFDFGNNSKLIRIHFPDFGNYSVVVFGKDVDPVRGEEFVLEEQSQERPQSRITFAQTGLGQDYSGTVLTIDGTGYTANDLPLTFLWDVNSMHSYSFASLLPYSELKRYVFDSVSGLSALQSDLLAITSSGIVTGNFIVQYYLSTTANRGSTAPGPGWYDSGSLVQVSANTPGGYVWGGWTGSGPGSYTGQDNPAIIQMNGPITESALWNIPSDLLSLPAEPYGWQYSDSSHNALMTNPLAGPLISASEQTVVASPGQTVTISVTYQVFAQNPPNNPGEIDQLFFVESWTTSWPPQGYTIPLYNGGPGLSPGVINTNTISFTAPSVSGTYYLWLCFEAQYNMQDAVNQRTQSMNGLPGHIRIVVSPPARPVGYWKFDEGSGTVAYDSSGNANSGTLYGPQWIDGRVGKALKFNGIDNYVSIPDSSSLDISGNQISVEFWVKFDNAIAGSSPYMKFYDKGNAYNSAMRETGNIRFTFCISGDSSANLDSSRTSWQADTWYHIAEVYDGSTMSIYVNGVLDNSMPMTGNIAVTTYPVAIGAYTLGGQYFLQGAMDEFKIYNYARTPEQIQADYQSSSVSLTDFIQLTTNPYDDRGASWSADSSMIAYSAFSDSWYRHIWVMNVDGSNKKQLTFGNVVDDSPAISPDGTKIVFMRYGLRGIDGSDLMIMNADGTNIQQLTFTGLHRGQPRWSHDGQRIAFYYGGAGTNTNEVHIMNADGTNEVTVASGTYAVMNPSWSPDDTKLVYTMDDGIWTVNTLPPYECTRIFQTSLPTTYAVYSPDGKYIMYASGMDGQLQNLYLIGGQGNFIAQLTHDTKFGYQFDWSPDGQYIAFDSISSGNWDVWRATVTNLPINMGPVGYWKFDEGSGNVAHDSSGNGSDGTVVGANWATGVSGGALQFDGIADYVGVPSSPSICVTGNQISVQLWMKPAATLDANTPITNILDKGDEYGFQMDQYSSGRIWFFVWLNGAPWQGIQTTTSSWEAGRWYLLTGTYDGSSLKVYVNGVLENSQSLSGDLYTSSWPLAIGSYCLGSKNFFNGALDEVKIYDYARTLGDILNDHNSLVGAKYQITFDQTGIGSDFIGAVVTIDGTNYPVSDLPLTFWWNEGSSHSYTFASQLTVNSTTQYVWSSTSGLSGLQSDSLTIASSGSVVGDYNVQNEIMFDQAGVNVGFTGTVLVVDGTPYSAVELPVSFYWTVGSTHSFVYESPLTVAANAEQCVWTGTTDLSSLQSDSITVSACGSIVGHYVTQYYVTFAQSGLDSTASGIVLTVNGTAKSFGDMPFSEWLNDSDALEFSFESIVSSGTLNTQFILSDVDASSPLMVTGAQTVTGSYGIQWRVTFDQDVLDETAIGTVVIVNGSSITHSGLQYSLWINSSDSLVFGYDNVSSTVSGERFTVDSVNATSPLTVTDSVTIIGTYKTQYYFKVTSSYGATGGEGWYDNGATVYATLDVDLVDHGNETRHVFTAWGDDGSGTDFAQSNPIVMNGAKTAIASWKTQYNVAFDQIGLDSSASSTIVTVDGSSETYGQVPYAIWVDDSYAVNYVYGNVSSSINGKQFILTSVAGPASPIIVTSPTTVTGNYKTQYYLIVNSSKDMPSPATGWFDDGTGIIASVSSPSSGGTGIQYVCTGWTGTGSVPASGVASSVTFVISAASTITWNWKTQYYLTVTSLYDSPSPPSGWFDNGTRITENVTSPASGPSGTRYLCTGWTGTGSVRRTGSGTTITFTILQASSITWNWKTQYLLTMAKNFGTITPSAGNHWYDAGSAANISATAPTVQVGEQFVWNGWIGSGSGSYTGPSNPVVNTVVMNGPVNETASWTHQYLLTVNASGIPSPYSITVILDGSNVGKASDNSPFTMWITAGTSTGTIGVDAQISGGLGTRYVFVSWSPGSAANPRPGMMMNAPKTLTATYKTQYQITFSQSGVLNDFTGTVVKIDKVNYSQSTLPVSFWWDKGSLHTFQFMSPLRTSTRQYLWTSTTGLSTVQSGTITVSGTGTVSANYVKR